MSRASPSVHEIVTMAERINAIALSGHVACVAGNVMDLIYSAVPGSPGQGLHTFENALHADVTASTDDYTGAWRFRRFAHNARRRA